MLWSTHEGEIIDQATASRRHQRVGRRRGSGSAGRGSRTGRRSCLRMDAQDCASESARGEGKDGRARGVAMMPTPMGSRPEPATGQQWHYAGVFDSWTFTLASKVASGPWLTTDGQLWNMQLDSPEMGPRYTYLGMASPESAASESRPRWCTNDDVSWVLCGQFGDGGACGHRRSRNSEPPRRQGVSEWPPAIHVFEMPADRPDAPSLLCHVCRLGSACTHAAKPRAPWVCPVDDWDLLRDA